jgi:hypothetical protein
MSQFKPLTTLIRTALAGSALLALKFTPVPAMGIDTPRQSGSTNS